MKLVTRFEVGNEHEGCWTVTQPINYKSAEDFIVDYDEWCKANEGRIIYLLTECFLGIFSNEKNSTLEVLTIEEWFEKYADVECI